MEEIKYIGEQLIYQRIGHFAILAGFVAAIAAAFAYFFATQKRNLPEAAGWRKLGRTAFLIHGGSVLTVIGVIFTAMLNRRFEYQYVWQHVSEDLPIQYIFSAFWEGQEGSFLLWMFWHVVLGGILLWRAKKWEAPVLSVLSLVQAFILSMILGIYLTENLKIGSSPLLLLRHTMNIPLFNNADYLSMIQGNGLNPLLQNYWMTIHPPTLFLGFASTVVPFAYATAGLWTKEHTAWLRPAMPWALFSGAVLGTGILMGGAWAYEALSFGGYWAWDPVENMSLVPWITLLAGIHTHLVARHTGYSVKSTYGFYLLSFLLVLYSTFLTRSGVLGETSVHAFTEMGLESQLLLFIFTFLGGSVALLLARSKSIAQPEKEEALPSREFWMFIGSLVLLFSAVIISVSTSLPVYNKIVQYFKPDFAGYTINDPVRHYNKYQLWIAFFIALLTAGAQFLRYREFNWHEHGRRFLKHIGIAAGAGAALTLAFSFWIKLGQWQFVMLAFSGFFSLASNVDYVITFLKGNLKLAGSAFAHCGFALLIAGVIASGLNKQNISNNPMAQAGLLDEEMLQKNVLLFKNRPMYMSGYRVTYKKDTLDGNLRTFVVNYEKLDSTGRVESTFEVRPQAIYDNKVVEVKAYQPSTKRYLDKDIFTHIATLPVREANFKVAQDQEDSLQYRTHLLGRTPLALLDTFGNAGGPTTTVETKVFIDSLNFQPEHKGYQAEKGDFAVGVRLGFTQKDTTYYAEPLIYLRGRLWGAIPVQVNDVSMKVRLPEAALLQLLEADSKLDFKKFTFKAGQSINLNGRSIRLTGINKDPVIEKEAGDIAVSAILEVTDPKTGSTERAEPVFLIRKGGVLTPKAAIPGLGLHFLLSKINPETETFEVMIAQGQTVDALTLPVEIAHKSLRTDYIVLEAIVFPGINLFWLGSILMMAGLAVSMFRRRIERGVDGTRI